MALYLQDLDCYETCSCPRCGIMTMTECVTSITKTGLVVGCSSCLPPVTKMSSTFLTQIVREALSSSPAKSWM